MANDGRKGGALDEMGQLTRRFNSPEEEEALALETLGTAGIAGMGPQVCAIYIYVYILRSIYIYMVVFVLDLIGRSDVSDHIDMYIPGMIYRILWCALVSYFVGMQGCIESCGRPWCL